MPINDVRLLRDVLKLEGPDLFGKPRYLARCVLLMKDTLGSSLINSRNGGSQGRF